MDKSYSDYISEILENTEGNAVGKDLLLNLFFNNLPENVSRKVKKTLDAYKLKPRAKTAWHCQHKGCQEISCDSHEISENSTLKNISSPDSNVVILKRDIKNNPIFYIEGTQHKRNATNFPGYCSKHDASLFSDIDSSNIPFNVHYVNKQCLRTTRAQIFEIDWQIKACDLFISDVLEEIREDEEIVEVIRNFSNKKAILDLKRKRLWCVYNEIFDGIESKNYALKFKSLPPAIVGFCFSACLDLTIDGDEDSCMLYVCKLDLKSSSETFVAYLDNDVSTEASDYFARSHQIQFGQVLYEHKNKLILSEYFASLIPEGIKEVLYKDDDLYKIGPAQHYYISTAFFSTSTSS